MAAHRALLVLLALCFIQSSSAQLRDPNEEVISVNSCRLATAPLRCSCSPSKRGYRNATLQLLRTGLAAILNEMKEVDIFDEELTRAMVASTVEKKMRDCFKRDGAEACINADEALRREGTYYCMYDRKTGKNLHFKNVTKDNTIVTVAGCDTDNVTRSCIAKVGENSKVPILKRPKHRNQGCVAVEHLDGYAVQHKRHLNRTVLCFDGFCATPDHALIVDGDWTSMEHLCDKKGGWNCTEDMKLVNNLKVFSKRRVRYNEHIVITPYDIRFPRAAIWIVQIAEATFDLVIQAISLGIAIILGLLMYNAAENFVADGEDEEETESSTLQPGESLALTQTPKSFKRQARAFLKKCGVTPKGSTSSGASSSIVSTGLSCKKEKKPMIETKTFTFESSRPSAEKEESSKTEPRQLKVGASLAETSTMPKQETSARILSNASESIPTATNAFLTKSEVSKTIPVTAAITTGVQLCAKVPIAEKSKSDESMKSAVIEREKEKDTSNDLD